MAAAGGIINVFLLFQPAFQNDTIQYLLPAILNFQWLLFCCHERRTVNRAWQVKFHRITKARLKKLHLKKSPGNFSLPGD